MKCHYDILGVSRDCGDDEIKKAYRKLALQWHPDKNPDTKDECTKQFHLIQQAYEVLIDPQERAWYDKHREAILRGGLGHGDKYEDNGLDVYQFFNASCYTGYDDDEKGFYAVYKEVFKKIALEDEEFMDGANNAPEFGSSQSVYEEVVGPFYAYWESYCTSKSYVWVEKYDTREAPNRQVRRVMEQENKKLCDKAKRERNEEVRALVAFVRKRDRRVQAYKKKLEQRAAEIARLAEEKKQRDRQQRLKDLENYKESSWSSMSELEHQLRSLEANVAEEFGELDSEEYSSDEVAEDGDAEINGEERLVDEATGEELCDEELYYNSLYCIACRKAFKSEKALTNHNRSKKHTENVARLQEEMLDEEGELVGVAEAEEDGETLESNSVDPDLVDSSLNEPTQRSRSKKQKKKRKQQKMQNSTQSDDEEDTSCPADPDVEEGDTEQAASETVVNDRVTNTPEDTSEAPPTSENVHVDTGNTSAKKTKTSKKKPESSQGHSDSTSSTETLLCNKCRAVFKSRNKLFEHIKATGHALRVDVPITETVTDRDSASGRKGKERKTRKK